MTGPSDARPVQRQPAAPAMITNGGYRAGQVRAALVGRVGTWARVAGIREFAGLAGAIGFVHCQGEPRSDTRVPYDRRPPCPPWTCPFRPARNPHAGCVQQPGLGHRISDGVPRRGLRGRAGVGGPARPVRHSATATWSTSADVIRTLPVDRHDRGPGDHPRVRCAGPVLLVHRAARCPGRQGRQQPVHRTVQSGDSAALESRSGPGRDLTDDAFTVCDEPA